MSEPDEPLDDGMLEVPLLLSEPDEPLDDGVLEVPLLLSEPDEPLEEGMLPLLDGVLSGGVPVLLP